MAVTDLLVSQWAPERVRKVFQSIALHGVGTISDYFETEINVIVNSILQDYQGPLFGLSQEIYDGIVKEFPANRAEVRHQRDLRLDVRDQARRHLR